MNAAAPADQPIAYIGLGSNIEPEANLPGAIAALRESGSLLAVSSAWKSAPVGSSGPDFLNAAVKFMTDLPAEQLKDTVLRPIEKQLGRLRGPDRFAPRTIDLDILIYAAETLDPDIWNLAYLAVPLSEIMPDLRHPQTGEALSEVAVRLKATQTIQRASLKLVQT